MSYLVAKSYKNFEQVGEPFPKKGKPYIKVKDTCGKCSGTGMYLHFGTCFACLGIGYKVKEVRVYSEKEYSRLEVAATNRAIKVKEDTIDRNEQKNIEFLEKHNIDIHGNLLVVIGNSFPVKDALKESGAVFVKGLGWILKTKIDLPDDVYIVKFEQEEVTNVSGYGLLVFKPYEQLIEIMSTFLPPAASTFQGEIGQKINRMLTVTSMNSFESRFGTGNIFKMVDEEDNEYTWFTATNKIEADHTYNITATVKDHSEYNGVEQTVITRCKVI